MNINELRIGNLVEWKGIIEPELCNITAILKDSVELDGTIIALEHNINPVLLTRDLLIKLGYKITRKSILKLKHGI